MPCIYEAFFSLLFITNIGLTIKRGIVYVWFLININPSTAEGHNLILITEKKTSSTEIVHIKIHRITIDTSYLIFI